MAIAYYAEDIELPAIKKRAVSGWVKAVAETYGKKTGDISYIFCSDEKILEVNRKEEVMGENPPISPTRLLHGYHHLRLYGRK